MEQLVRLISNLLFISLSGLLSACATHTGPLAYDQDGYLRNHKLISICQAKVTDEIKNKFGSKAYIHFHYAEVYLETSGRAKVDGDAISKHHGERYKLIYECDVDRTKGSITDIDLYWNDQN